ncbi:N-acetyltransferase [Sphingomonas sp.]|jgi:GNAT superfamily N-acetyltransferase|uniref:GNAT family N-acetyltransferase n=1 Tax=Sphingomonas sp. TaxID=28214 RepID=UPI002625E19E|nr:GNAT family N-acetyltransferase [Sphingomonas sp.]MDF2603585.1 GCN5-like N-acetyltransferase [Sphingomonas sp.]
MSLRVTVPDKPSDAHQDLVLALLHAHNVSRAGDPRIKPVAVLLTDEDGAHVGGLWGQCAYNWLFVELIAIPEEHRGHNHGTALMEQAEAIARANDCIGVWLDTFEFQARGFYEKLGYEVFGAINDHPAGQKRFFLSKRL